MKQSPLLEFESDAFEVIPGEDDQTNPGIYGKSLALWLAEPLRSTGVSTGAIIAEDFGGGMIARLRGRDESAQSVATLFAAVRRCLESAPSIRGLREETI